jgi:HK97 family phage prohead protease
MDTISWQHPTTGQTVTFQDCRPAPAEPEPVRFLTAKDVAGHEARHAAAGLLMGMRVIEARADIPTTKAAGQVLWDSREDGVDVRDAMVMLLVGPLGDPSMEIPWPPAWPLDPNSRYWDSARLAEYAASIALTEHGYNKLCGDARRLSADPTFKDLEHTLAVLLENMVTLTEPMLADLRDMVTGNFGTKGATAVLLHKSFDMTTGDTGDAGTFTATVAVFGNVDRGNDRIMPGAFDKTLAKWRESGDPIPVIFNHNWGSPDAHIGVVDEARETDKGLWVKGTLDVEDNPVARQVHKLMARRSLKEFSFGYDVPVGGSRKARDGATELHEIDLAEVGPTLKGMNPSTELHSVKSAVLATDPNRPTADELRHRSLRVAAEVLIDSLDLAPREPERRVPTVKELNAQCRELGLPTLPDREAQERADVERTLYRAWFGR